MYTVLNTHNTMSCLEAPPNTANPNPDPDPDPNPNPNPNCNQPKSLLEALKATRPALRMGLPPTCEEALDVALQTINEAYWERYRVQLDDIVWGLLGLPEQGLGLGLVGEEDRGTHRKLTEATIAVRLIYSPWLGHLMGVLCRVCLSLQVLHCGAVAAWDFYGSAAQEAFGREGNNPSELGSCLESLAPREWTRWREAYGAVRAALGLDLGERAACRSQTGTMLPREAGPPGVAEIEAAIKAAMGGDWAAYVALAGGRGSGAAQEPGGA